MGSEPITIHNVDGATLSDLNDHDRAVIQDVDRALAAGLRLKQWWERKEQSGDYSEKFELARTFNQSDFSFGFFDTAPLDGRDLQVMGLAQEMQFDMPKQAAPEKVRDELREFIMRYFMRVSDFRQPDAFVKGGTEIGSEPQLGWRLLSWCPEEVDTRAGFGYSQLYYKLRASGQIGKFPDRERTAIVDLREIGVKYEWIVCEVRIFNFDLRFRPLGSESFALSFPLKEATYIVLSRDFITSRDDALPDLLGEYGFGYALLKPAPAKSIFAYGPGHFTAGFQLINFTVQRNGSSRAKLAFVSNRPDKVLNIDIDPVGWSFKLADLMSFGLVSQVFGPLKTLIGRLSPRLDNFDPVTAWIGLANFLTGGLAAKEWCLSLKALEKNPMLVTHFMQHYQMLTGALMTWRHVFNWLESERIPEWVRLGNACDACAE